MHIAPMTLSPMLRSVLVALLATAASVCALAQFKVVDADGRVTYTDRPPSPTAGNQVTSVRRSAPAATVETTLPLELRRSVERFPVTLYTMADCALCDRARAVLHGRGIPHSERTVDDAGVDELVRATGGRTLPTLTVGTQVMRGFAESDWQSTLDLAGYPRESRLPRSYVHAVATPLVARPAPAAPLEVSAAPVPAPPPERVEPEPEPGVPSIRF